MSPRLGRLESEPLTARVDGARQAGIAGQRAPLRAHDVQQHEMPIVTPQSGQQARAQERRLTRPGGAEHHEQAVDTGGTHCPQHVQRTHDLGVPAEEHAGVELLERLPATVGRPVGLRGGRPDEVVRRDPGAAQCVAQLAQPRLGEDYWRTALHRNGFDSVVAQTVDKEIGVLPFAGVPAGVILQPAAQDLLPQVLGGSVFRQALG